MHEDVYLYIAYREHVDQWFNCTGPRFETNVTLGLYKAHIAVGLRNTGADCLEVYVRYNITEGAERLGNISTGSGGGMNVGSAYCLPSGEEAQWWLIFLPRSLGKVVILISSEGRYIEWGEPKVYKPPEHEIVLNIIPRQEPSYSEGIITVGILVTAALVIGLGIKIRSSGRRHKTPVRANLIHLDNSQYSKGTSRESLGPT